MDTDARIRELEAELRTLRSSKPRKKKALPRILEPEQLSEVFSALPCGSSTQKRDKAAIMLMEWAGLRRREIVNLRLRDVTFGDVTTIRVPDLPGCKTGARTVPVSNRHPGHQALQEWLSLRPDSEWLFCSHKGTQLAAQQLWRVLNASCVSIGLTWVHPHTLRHTAASRWLSEGYTLADVQMMLGHSSPSSTIWYLHANPVHLVERARRV